MMDLNEEQKQAVAGWVDKGQSISDIQKGLQEQFAISMTYMDLRFMLLDLGLELKDKEEPEDAEPELDPEPLKPEGGVSVEVDRVVKPGALVSGTVSFPDGRRGAWALDQTGRLALDMGDPDYKPSKENIAAFQQALKDALEKRGF